MSDPNVRTGPEVGATDPAEEPPPGTGATSGRRPRRVLAEVKRLDEAAYAAVATTPTPTLDTALRRLSGAADKSRLWFATAGVIAIVGGRRGRTAALAGVTAIGVTSAVVNLGFKRMSGRTRPDRTEAEHTSRHVAMPQSSSFPSGHSASAFAFAEAVSATLPLLGIPLRLTAATVAYSRIHTGVHYPGDVLIGSLIGMTSGELVARSGDRLFSRIAGPGGT